LYRNLRKINNRPEVIRATAAYRLCQKAVPLVPSPHCRGRESGGGGGKKKLLALNMNWAAPNREVSFRPPTSAAVRKNLLIPGLFSSIILREISYEEVILVHRSLFFTPLKS
jgi:hypothetical protein